jgi:sugar lactone lactonase YvrE
MEAYESKVVAEGLGFGEGPRWREGRLWFSDFYRRAIFSVNEQGTDERLEHSVPTQPSGLGWLANGDLLFVSATDQKVMRHSGGTTTVFADISEHCNFWANDMLTTPAGYSYVGNFGFDLDTLLREVGVEGLLNNPPPSTNLVVLDSNGKIIQVVPELNFPNGTVISQDEKTLIVGETFGFCLTAFDIADDGTLSNRRVWAPTGFAVPDGNCIDAEGQIWFANPFPDTNEVLRIDSNGEVTARVSTTQTAFACALGGKDLTTLYIMTCTSSDRFVIDGKTLGKIETAQVAVKGFSY